MLQHVIICSLICVLIHSATKEGMLLAKPAMWLSPKLKWAAKPLFACLTCMCSVWGSAYWLIFDPDMSWLPFILAVGGVNAIVDVYLGFIEFMTTIRRFQDDEGI